MIAKHYDLSGLAVYLDCGDKDAFNKTAKVLNDTLIENGYKSQFHLNSGDHSSKYISGNTEDYLRFYLGNTK